MKKIFVVLSIVIIAVLGTSLAWASIPGPDGVVNGCYKNSNGDLIVIDSAASCPMGYTALNWNQTGPAGPQGPVGVSGFEEVQAVFQDLAISPTQSVARGVNCPQGKVALGGGYNVAGPGVVGQVLNVTEATTFNDPLGVNSGFVVHVESEQFTGAFSFFVRATCANVS